MYLGVDYYPEHWPKEMMEEDIQGIKELGANIVRIGEFAWHLMEPKEGEFDFSFFDHVIAKLKQQGFSILFGTPTATFPAWLAKKYPEILSKDENGNVRVFGGRRQYCFNSDVYRTYSARITQKLVEHYRDEEAIVAWQIDNEFGHEGSDMCYCEQCHEKFQLFLQDKYETIDALNEAYGTIFWGQTYNDFTEIPIPKKTITTHNPSLQLDWARFRSYSVNSYAHEMTNIVRQHKGAHQQVTTNVSGGFFQKWFDHEENVKYMDFVSYDNYPVWGGLMEPISPAAIAMTHDFIRGLLGKNYWIVEELMGAQGHDVIGCLPRPNQAKMWSYQAFAHGCTNMLYFRWRGMNRGAEQFCYGIVDHSNRRGRKYREVQSFFAEIASHEPLIQSEIRADIAVLYDYDNIWSWRFQRQSEGFDFTNELLRLYTPFYKWNTHIDVIPVTRDFSKYKVLLVPALQIIDEALGKRFEAFVKQGGTIIFSFRTGLKDKHNNIHFKKVLPGYVREIAGIEVHEVESLSVSQRIRMIGEGKYTGKTSYCSVWRDLVTPVTAEILYRYDDSFYPQAAVTKNTYEKGTVYYVGCGAEEDVLQAIAKDVVLANDIWHIPSEEGVEVYKRGEGDDSCLFVMNHTAEEKVFQHITLHPYESKIVLLNQW
ncbi:beta-galactosidase [Anoxybacteroides amylolyticum]|uniref:Beta-galactosidase n=1 Tax=Anoxybacteroides amylolyticum TaxID=294699 RepID=A0A167TAS9_9BACL|nr:beta-galactosidase [Anoxybacillus amylolyticus]ANB59814.1 glycosyl hydrolase 14 family protein [Anoxybacillus amylolyticus]